MIFLSLIYRFFATFHRYLYEYGILKKVKLNKPVFSIGNLSMGGSGKTPLTLFLYDELIKKNKTPAIICRSYNASLRRSEAVPVDADPKVYGDEAVFYKLKRPEAVVVSGPSKLESAKLAEQLNKVDILLVDDGFQHHKLFKDWNGIVVDLSVNSRDNKLFPIGRLREPWETLRFACAVFFSRSEYTQSHEVAKIVQEVAPQAPCFKIESQLNLASLKDKKYLLVSAIGNPHQFYSQMSRLFPNCEFLEVRFPDHHSYTQSDINRVEQTAYRESIDQIICTEKDFVKIKKLKFNSLLWQCVEQKIQITPIREWNLYIDKLYQEYIT